MLEPKLQELTIGTILSNRTKEGMVEFRINDELIAQFDIAKAKEIYHMFGEAIEAAVSDTLIYKFMREKVGMDEEKASRILLDFREIRQGTKGVAFPQ